ncbi:hypothetical protein ACL02S_23640 [Nocardia sp. 004]|uniref:hypothetical protein n=1 Tax=Nocardia sp. 004 TaxID=3385978 RepID=UPI0039A221E2
MSIDLFDQRRIRECVCDVGPVGERGGKRGGYLSGELAYRTARRRGELALFEIMRVKRLTVGKHAFHRVFPSSQRFESKGGDSIREGIRSVLVKQGLPKRVGENYVPRRLLRDNGRSVPAERRTA